MKTVSVIVPVYNGEMYLRDCLDSICTQTYQSIEVVVIDDGSKDGSARIIKEYANKDSRVVAYFNDNHGVSCTRNFGIEHSSGEYIAFVDADDILSTDFVETLVKIIEDNKADMSAVGVIKKQSFQADDFSSGNLQVFHGSDVLKELFGVYEGFLWNKLYRREIIQNYNLSLRKDIAVCEDLLFNTQYLMNCASVAYDSGKKYFYRQNENSVSNRLDNIKWFDSIKAYSVILKMLKKMPEAYMVALQRYALLLCAAKYRVRFVQCDRPKIEKEVISEWNSVRVSRKKFSIGQRIKLLVFDLFPSLVMMYKRRKL